MKYDQISEAYLSMHEAYVKSTFDAKKYDKHTTAELGDMVSDWYKDIHNVRPAHMAKLGVDRKVTLNHLKDLHDRENWAAQNTQTTEAYESTAKPKFDASKFDKHTTAELGDMASDWYKEEHNARPHHIKNLGVDRKVTLQLLKDLHGKEQKLTKEDLEQMTQEEFDSIDEDQLDEVSLATLNSYRNKKLKQGAGATDKGVMSAYQKAQKY